MMYIWWPLLARRRNPLYCTFTSPRCWYILLHNTRHVLLLEWLKPLCPFMLHLNMRSQWLVKLFVIRGMKIGNLKSTWYIVIYDSYRILVMYPSSNILFTKQSIVHISMSDTYCWMIMTGWFTMSISSMWCCLTSIWLFGVPKINDDWVTGDLEAISVTWLSSVGKYSLSVREWFMMYIRLYNWQSALL